MKKKNNEHYITIQEFMVSELELSGNELIAYALIYGFSQDGESCFKGSLSYVSKWLNCSKTTAFNILNKLSEDGFLKKKEKIINGVKLCDYMAYEIDEGTLKEIKAKKEERKEREKSERRSKNLNTNSKNHKGRSKNENGYSKNLNDGVQKVDTHITKDILKDIKDDNLDDNIEKEHTVSKDTAQVHTVVSGRNNVHREKPIEKYLSLKDKDTDMLKRVLKISLRDYDEETAKEIFLTIEHFLMRYTQRTGKIHPILSDEALERIVWQLADLEDTEYNHFPKPIEKHGSYIKVVDEYFHTKFGGINGGKVNYRLPHFASYEILSRLAQRVLIYGGEEDSE